MSQKVRTQTFTSLDLATCIAYVLAGRVLDSFLDASDSHLKIWKVGTKSLLFLFTRDAEHGTPRSWLYYGNNRLLLYSSFRLHVTEYLVDEKNIAKRNLNKKLSQTQS